MASMTSADVHELSTRFSTRKGDDTVGNPYRANIYRFDLFELILFLKLDKQFPVEQIEATALIMFIIVVSSNINNNNYYYYYYYYY